jgi:uncharacterized protein YcfJ
MENHSNQEDGMKRITSVFLSAVMFFSIIGCQSSPNRAGEGAVIGGLVGAGAGMIIGNQGHNRGQGRTEGALIGGALGALGGALVGSQVQKQPAQQQAVQAQQQTQTAANPNQMSLQQIADLAKQGIHEDVIIDRIRLSNSKFNLSPADVTYLQQNGVSEKVIKVMQGL